MIVRPRQSLSHERAALYAGTGLAMFLMLGMIIAAIVLVVVAMALLIPCAVAGWAAYYFLGPGRKRRNPVKRLTEQYVAGRLDIGEFERRLDGVLRRP